jgi:Mor family transcriptional regulator
MGNNPRSLLNYEDLLLKVIIKMPISRQEMEKKVEDLYFNQGKTFRDIAKDLRLSFTRISQIVRKHQNEIDEKSNNSNNITMDKCKPQLSLSSQAYKLFSKGKTSVEVAIELDLPEPQVTQLHLEYWRLKSPDKIETLYAKIGTNIFPLLKLYNMLVIERKMSVEEVAKVVEIDLFELPDMKARLEEYTREEARKKANIESLDEHLDGATREMLRKNAIIEFLNERIQVLEEEEKRRKRMVMVPPPSYHFVENSRDPVMNANPAYHGSTINSSVLPYYQSNHPDLRNENRKKLENPREKEEIHEMYDGDIAD